jgi:hypothetical protein
MFLGANTKRKAAREGKIRVPVRYPREVVESFMIGQVPGP